MFLFFKFQPFKHLKTKKKKTIFIVKLKVVEGHDQKKRILQNDAFSIGKLKAISASSYENEWRCGIYKIATKCIKVFLFLLINIFF